MKKNPFGRGSPPGGFFFCLSLNFCEFIVSKIEKSVFKNAVAVYFKYTKNKFNNYTRDTCVCVFARAPARAGREKRKPRGGLARSYGAAVGLDRRFQLFRKVAPLFGRATPLPSSVYFLRALPAPINKNPRPGTAFLFFCMPGRYRCGGGNWLDVVQSRTEEPAAARSYSPTAPPATFQIYCIRLFLIFQKELPPEV